MIDYVNPDDERQEQIQEILLNENELLNGLLELGKEKDRNAGSRKIQIKRDGVVKLEFRVRPISEDESQNCWRKATKYTPFKKGEPRKALETDNALFRSYIIYTATLDEDRMKTWDNKNAMAAFQVFNSVEMIDRILLAGEKAHVIDIIDDISGFGELEDNASN